LPERVAEEERFNPERVINALKDKSINANYFKNKDEIVEYLKKNTKEGDVILIMSNGGFNNIYDKLVEALNGSF
jgi:UDP-N-acetylmuramate: L-alanyl-gamma-D-glutamyl-meso-diaminopimelate ligase